MSLLRSILPAVPALLVCATLCAAQTKPYGRNVADTPHNLSVTGGGGAHDVKSSVETRICIFCHTPHHATQTPLWSREVPPDTIYTPYKSTTMKANPKPDKPKNSSRLCLSCHDGTIALGALGPGGTYVIDASLPKMPSDIDPAKNARIGKDLSDDHPISFPYPSLANNPELNDPSTLWGSGIKLSADDYVECTSCHDPHNNQYGNFTVLDLSVHRDALCTKCHNKAGWSDKDSTHRTGGTRYPSISSGVEKNGCTNCHLVHSAQQGEHLLQLPSTGAGEETNCYSSCHNGAPYSNIYNEFNTKTYTHPISTTTGVHKSDESLPVSGGSAHVECTDCHNPHQAGWEGAPLGAASPLVPPASVAPNVNGPLRGVRGVDETGTVAVTESTFEFQICFKCHAGGSSDKFISTYIPPKRAFRDYDESNRFASGNPSYHPVTANRLSTGASLVSQYQTSMVRIYCTDCHLPHGGNEPHILNAQNWDTYPSPVSNYPLCFRCHERLFLLDPFNSPHSGSAALHKSHVLDHANKAPCSACHDPHGVPATLATTTTAGHLVNFDRRYTGEGPLYDSVARSCTVAGTCHASNPTRSY
jgi:predicted CXXCH cytochrome family protein